MMSRSDPPGRSLAAEGAVEHTPRGEGPGPDPTPPRAEDAMSSPSQDSSPPDPVGQELLFFGNEEILRGSDNGTLVAFAAIAFQELRGGGESVHRVGCIFLLFSVLFCALVHFALGNAYIYRARSMIRRQPSSRPRRRAVFRVVNLGLVWVTVLSQFACLAVGLLLILPERPPGLLVRHLLPLFE
ncbi:hypothetical protein [Tautonia plasticadhaerens]|uniref:Uncharacterized protein n=1 Tax=Tautonia plasticadhaerens TaxID=2527974 RepID=A0A518H2N1_9BACT|nr:hypothetical protein [Tautonia plasticadhaerens]QDV35084.1 hypothetical protein ElP_29860 [Tautonia plasticadhaerens]